MAKSTLTRGKTAFLDYYSALLPGLDIEHYLTRKNAPVLLVSPLYESELRQQFTKSRLSWKPLDWFPNAVYWPPEVQIGNALPGLTEGQLYSLNPASLLPLLALKPHSQDSILDTSAAPGGKTLAMLCLSHPHYPTIIANDASGPRSRRLQSVLKNFGFPDIPVINHPVQALPHVLTGHFDKILLDAPCSSEKHVFNSKLHLKLWSPNRIATLAHLQELLITTLEPMLKPGGTMVYSTCAINPSENEDVISHSLAKHPNLTLAGMSQTFPPTDPMFVTLLRKQLI